MLVGSFSMLYQLNRIMSTSRNDMATSLERLASGTRVNSASDDPASLILSSRMNTEAKSIASAISNAQWGVTYSQLANDAYASVISKLNEAKNLAQSATNSTYTASQRSDAQAQMDAIMNDLSTIKSGANLGVFDVFGDGAVGNVDTVVTASTTLGTPGGPTVISGARDYVMLSSNVDQSSIEVRDASNNVVAHTLDTSNINDGYLRVDFTGTTGASVYFTNPTMDSSQTFSIDEVTSAYTPAPPASYTAIYTASELVSLTQADPSGNYILANDIDLSGETGWTALGGPMFTGVLDGNGFTISGLNATTNGLFHELSGGAAVRNLAIDNFTVNGGNVDGTGILTDLATNATIENINITNSSITVDGYSSVGGVVGDAVNTSITNVAFQGSVTGSGNVSNYGGIIGYAGGSSSLQDVSADVTLSTDLVSYVGGIAGFTSTASVDDAYANVNMTLSAATGISVSNIGGLVGYAYNGTISDSRTTGTITDNGYGTSYSGGFLGQNSGAIISDSLSEVNVGTPGQTHTSIGGFVGYHRSGVITNSAATGNIVIRTFDGVNTGGFAGRIDGSGSVSNSYSTGTISDTSNVGDHYLVAGFVGNALGATITNSYSTSDIILDDAESHGIAGFAAHVNSGASFDQTHYEGNITLQDSYTVGGFAAWTRNDSVVIQNSYANANISITSGTNVYNIGGFIGRGTAGSISSSYSEGAVNITAVTSAHEIGGFIGLNTSAEINTSKTMTDLNISGEATNIGGFVGSNSTNISTSIAQGLMNFDTANHIYTNIGGFVGENLAGTIGGSYADENFAFTTGGTTEVNYFGGFAGILSGGGVEFSYTDLNAVTVGGDHLGGFVGEVASGASIIDSTLNMSGTMTVRDVMQANYVGGFAGSVYGSIGSSQATNVNMYVNQYQGSGYGGFAGYIGNTGAISDSLSRGDLDVSSYSVSSFGGFVGSLANGGTVTDSLAEVTIDDSFASEASNKGAFIGSRGGVSGVTDVVYNIDTANGLSAVGSGSANGISGLLNAQIDAGTAVPMDGWSSIYWDLGSGDPVVSIAASVLSIPSFSTAGKGSGALSTPAYATPSAPTISTMYDLRPVPEMTNTVDYTELGSLVQSGFTYSAGFNGSEYKFSDTANIYVDNLVVKDGGTTLTRGVDYDWYIRDGASQYSIEMLTDSYFGKSLTVSYDMLNKNLDTVVITEATEDVTTVDVAKNGVEEFDAIQNIGLQVGTSANTYDTRTLQSFAMDLGDLHMDVSDTYNASYTVQSIDEVIDELQAQQMKANTTTNIYEGIIDTLESQRTHLNNGLTAIRGANEAEETANYLEAELRYNTTLDLMDFMMQKNYSLMSNLLGTNSSQEKGGFSFLGF